MEGVLNSVTWVQNQGTGVKSVLTGVVILVGLFLLLLIWAKAAEVNSPKTVPEPKVPEAAAQRRAERAASPAEASPKTALRPSETASRAKANKPSRPQGKSAMSSEPETREMAPAVATEPAATISVGNVSSSNSPNSVTIGVARDVRVER